MLYEILDYMCESGLLQQVIHLYGKGGRKLYVGVGFVNVTNHTLILKLSIIECHCLWHGAIMFLDFDFLLTWLAKQLTWL